MKNRILGAALAGGLVLALAPAASANDANLTFDQKSVSANAWKGAVGGDIAGSLRTNLRSREISGARWHVATDWIVRAGDQSFTARLRGVINVRTRAAVLSGRVSSGYLAGARVYAKGRLVNRKTGRLVGTLNLVPVVAPAPAPPADPAPCAPPSPDGGADPRYSEGCRDFFPPVTEAPSGGGEAPADGGGDIVNVN